MSFSPIAKPPLIIMDGIANVARKLEAQDCELGRIIGVRRRLGLQFPLVLYSFCILANGSMDG